MPGEIQWLTSNIYILNKISVSCNQGRLHHINLGAYAP